MKFRLLLALIATLLMAGLAAAADKIVFSSNESGNYDIWMINPDGSGKIQITNSPIDEFSPKISHDGKTIAFTRFDGGAYQGNIYFYDVATKTIAQITSANDVAYDLSWNPDDTKIAYSRACGGRQIAVYDIASKAVTVLTVCSGGSYGVIWHPTDDHIYYWDNIGGCTWAMFSVPAGGGSAERADGRTFWDTDWSFNPTNPNDVVASVDFGTSCAHGSYLARLDRSNNGYTLLHGGGSIVDRSPRWSPDGTKIAFASGELNAVSNLYVYDVLTASVVQLTNLSTNSPYNTIPDLSWGRINECSNILADDFTGTQLDVSKWDVHSDAQSCGATVTQNDSLVLTFPDNANNCGHLYVVSIRDFSSYADNISFEVDARTTTLRNWQDQPLYFCSPYGAIGYQNDGNKWYVVYVQSDGQYKTEYVLTEVISDVSYRLRIEVTNGVLTFSRSVDGGSMSSLLSVAAGQFLSNAYQVAPQAFLYPGRVVLASSDRGDTYFDNLVVTSCPSDLRVADMAVVFPDSLPPAPNMRVTITIGNRGTGRNVSDIDPASVRINGTLKPESQGARTGYPGFVGSALACVAKVRDLGATYTDRFASGLDLAVSGIYRDGTPFTVRTPIKFFQIMAGDFNGDGVVDGKDVTALASYLKTGGPSPVSIGNADVNRDGKIDLSDLSSLVKLVGGTRAESSAF